MLFASSRHCETKAERCALNGRLSDWASAVFVACRLSPKASATVNSPAAFGSI